MTESKQGPGQTLRLNEIAFDLLDQLTLEQRRARGRPIRKHDLLVEAVNDLFRKYGKPPVA